MKPCTPPSVLALRGQAPEPSPGSETTKPHAAWHSSIVQSPCSPEALGSSDGHVGGFASSGQDGAAGESSTRDGVSTRDTCADDASRPSISARMAAPCPALLSAEDRASGWSEGPSTVCRVFSQPTSCMASHSQHAWHPTRFTRSPYRSCGVIASVVTQGSTSRVSCLVVLDVDVVAVHAGGTFQETRPRLPPRPGARDTGLAGRSPASWITRRVPA